MKIILNNDVQNLGEEGDICDVARGHARNYLLPRGFAVPYTKQNINVFEHKRAAIEKRKEEKRKAALGLKEKLEELTLVIKMPVGSSGKLFGSVNNAVIAEELQKYGISVERKKIDVPDNSIRMIGISSVKIKLYSDEVAIVKVDVQSDKEVPVKAEKAEKAPKAKVETPVEEASAPAEESEVEDSEGASEDEA